MNDFPEFEGFWWLPDAVDKQMPGRLVSEGDAAKLLLTIDTPDVHPFERTQPHYYDVIHGRTSDGKSISLLNCFHLNSQRSSAGIETRAILVNYVLEGALVPKECSETAFCGFSLKWPTLQRWFMKSGVEVTWGERLTK